MRTWPPRCRVGALSIALLLLAACGADSEAPTVAEATTTTTMPGPTTTLPPSGRQPTPDDPLRVTVAGDSVMAEVAPALIQALEEGGASEAEFLLTPAIARDQASTFLWERQLDQFDPDVVVLLVGVWEDRGIGDAVRDEAWAQSYLDEVVNPQLDLVESSGAEMIWVGMAPVADDATSLRLAGLNALYAQATGERDTARYIDGASPVADADGSYAEFLPSTTGVLERVRRLDGVHICPSGVARVAEPVLVDLVAQWNVPVAYGWQMGSWREPPLLVAPEECPPPPSAP